MEKEFEMSVENFEALKEACRPVPLVALHCGGPPSRQAMANTAWKNLGQKMGFDGMTAKPVPNKGPRFFTAEKQERRT